MTDIEPMANTTINVTNATLTGTVSDTNYTGKLDTANFTGSVTYSATTPPPDTSTAGLIENFNAACSARFKVGGLTVGNDNANKSWSIVKRDDYTLRFEVRQGDRYSSSGWTDPSTCNRSEISYDKRWPANVETSWGATVTVAAGPISTASWFGFAQLHTVSDNPSCPVVVQLEQNTDKLQIVVQSPTNSWNRIYLAPQKIVRGKPMSILVKAKMNPSGGGYCRAWLDGTQIVDWSGAIGGNNTDYYWKCGAYRQNVAETMQLDLNHIDVK